MRAIAAEVGMSLPGVWARYYRVRPAKQADASARTAPIRMVPWQRVLTEGLNEGDVIGVRATATAHLGHEPTRAQITAARRAAHGLVAAGLARAVHVPVRLGDAAREVNHLVLVRSDAVAGPDQVLDAATWKPPAPDQPSRRRELSLTALGTAARNSDLDRLSAEQASHLGRYSSGHGCRPHAAGTTPGTTRQAPLAPPSTLELRRSRSKHTAGEFDALSGVRALTRAIRGTPQVPPHAPSGLSLIHI